jgi:ABC-2 type transport system ATP-binding protein
MLATYLPPTSGTAKVAGFDIASESDQVRKVLGYLPENPPLYTEMTVAEYLTFVAKIKGVPTKMVPQRVERSLERCFLKDVRNKLCQHLSRGFRQRVGIAQAIIHDPQVIILDEPTSGLDPKQIIEIRQLIASLAEAHTVLISTHILAEVSMVCTKVVIINQGRIVLENQLSALPEGRTLEQVFLEAVSSDDLHKIAVGG